MGKVASVGCWGCADAFRDKILPLRARAEVRNGWLEQRLDEVLPAIMKREGFDMWIVDAREYNEDPVLMTLLPEPVMSARRRCIGKSQRFSASRLAPTSTTRCRWLWRAAWASLR